ncbi:hypothetical protein [Nonomuraea cavernae]
MGRARLIEISDDQEAETIGQGDAAPASAPTGAVPWASEADPVKRRRW